LIESPNGQHVESSFSPLVNSRLHDSWAWGKWSEKPIENRTNTLRLWRNAWAMAVISQNRWPNIIMHSWLALFATNEHPQEKAGSILSAQCVLQQFADELEVDLKSVTRTFVRGKVSRLEKQ
jgi:hypothetical protein